MKVVVDTNVLFSIVFYPSQQLTDLYEFLQSEHEFVVFDYVIEELMLVATRKRPGAMASVQTFLESISVHSADSSDVSTSTIIRDAKDQPILDAAIAIGADIILTGDKDFTSLEIDHPRIMTPSQFIAEFL